MAPDKKIEHHYALVYIQTHMYARISSSRVPATEIVAFAGGPNPHTLLQAMSNTLLDMFDTSSVLPLRAVNKDFKNAIATHAWANMTIVKRDLAHWRACFPRAQSVNLSNLYNTLVDTDLVHVQGIKNLDMSYCWRITGESFHYLRGIQQLTIRGCWKITDNAIQQLVGIRDLDVICCKGIMGSTLIDIWTIRNLQLCWCNCEAIVQAVGIKKMQKLTIVDCKSTVKYRN